MANISTHKLFVFLVGAMLGWPVFAANNRPDIQAEAAIVQDVRTGAVVYSRNAQALRPIASLTKLMTALVVLDRQQDMLAPVTIDRADVDTLKHSRSRIPIGQVLTRQDALKLALVASDNRAAHALARQHPQGLPGFVSAMNAKAQAMGLTARFVEPTGLDSHNQASAESLAQLARLALKQSAIREITTLKQLTIKIAGRPTVFVNTNNLVRSGQTPIRLSKTGYTGDAGRCLVVVYQHRQGDRVLVLLNARSKAARTKDAIRLLRLA